MAQVLNQSSPHLQAGAETNFLMKRFLPSEGVDRLFCSCGCKTSLLKDRGAENGGSAVNFLRFLNLLKLLRCSIW